MTASYTWAQLGVSGDLLQAAIGQPFVFWSADGTSFKRIAQPVPASRTAQVHISADASGFALLAQNSSGATTVSHSADGQQWQQEASLPSDFNDVVAVGSLAGRTVVVGNSFTGDPSSSTAQANPSIATLDGGHWTESSFGAVLGSSDSKVTVEAAGIGPLGVAAVVGDGTSHTVLFSHDAATWSVQPLSKFVTGDIGAGHQRRGDRQPGGRDHSAVQPEVHDRSGARGRGGGFSGLTVGGRRGRRRAG